MTLFILVVHIILTADIEKCFQQPFDSNRVVNMPLNVQCNGSVLLVNLYSSLTVL